MGSRVEQSDLGVALYLDSPKAVVFFTVWLIYLLVWQMATSFTLALRSTEGIISYLT